jgi:hypothetical protein
MRRRVSLLPALFLTIATACGGGSASESSDGSPNATDAGSTVEPSSSEPAASIAAGSAESAPSAPASGAAGSVIDGAQIDPSTGEFCDLLDAASVAAALGVPSADVVSNVDDNETMAECTYMAADVGMVIQVLRQMGTDSVRAEGAPLGVGDASYVFEREGRRYADLAINGWYVILGTAAGTPTDTQFATVGQLLGARLVGRGDSPNAPAPLPSEPGTCTVEITGGVNVSYTGTQRIGEAYAEVWATPEQIAAGDAAFPGGQGAPDFQIGCTNDAGGSLLITLFGVAVPLGSPSVSVPVNQAGYFSDTVLLGNPDAFDITLTTFDETRIVGSFSFTGTAALSESGSSTVTVTFDFVRGI